MSFYSGLHRDLRLQAAGARHLCRVLCKNARKGNNAFGRAEDAGTQSPDFWGRAATECLGYIYGDVSFPRGS